MIPSPRANFFPQCLPAQPYSVSYFPSFSPHFPSLNPLSHIPSLPFLPVPPSTKLRKPSPQVTSLIRPMLTGQNGVVLRPHRGPRVGGVSVKVGREDERGGKEVATTGWVIVRFKPRPTGIRSVSIFCIKNSSRYGRKSVADV